MHNPFEEIHTKLSGIEALLREMKASVKAPPQKKLTEYLPRVEVAEMLKIDLSSVHNWTKKGILTAYQIGGRVYYKRTEVENAIIKLKK